MALIDEYEFKATAGSGGDGVVRWRREKFRPNGGPSGGNGGRGGDFYIEAIRDVTALGHISNKVSFAAENGHPGADNSKTGANGDDHILKLPVGSVVTNVETKEVTELLNEGERVLLLKGGEGGLGNEYFKSSTNQRPMEATKGKEGDIGDFTVELRLIADVGLIGLPNAGKSSFLNALTNATAKIGAYPFTTLEPNLGVYHKYVIADIPGLIEGASGGKGLGHKFLRHISRTNVILHCISLERDDILEDYGVIRKELESFPGIIEKKEYVLLTKTDTVTEEDVASAIKLLEKQPSLTVLGAVTILDDNSVKSVADKLTSLLTKE